MNERKMKKKMKKIKKNKKNMKILGKKEYKNPPNFLGVTLNPRPTPLKLILLKTAENGRMDASCVH